MEAVLKGKSIALSACIELERFSNLTTNLKALGEGGAGRERDPKTVSVEK